MPPNPLSFRSGGSAISLNLIITPGSPTLGLPVTNGQLVATLTGMWSNGAPFTGAFIFAPPNGNHGGDYAIVGNQLQVANAANLNALGSVTVEHVTIEAVQ